ncbi:organomercurial lyase [Corynebacterium heidelbergense]|uniref:organomercurial lyase n=1 Tax=Corynebacterium heidelbergense TaxID=2055947 RepID=UPI00235845C3|nr:organomercurial lyase [Corynebacterium heidelbergense]
MTQLSPTQPLDSGPHNASGYCSSLPQPLEALAELLAARLDAAFGFTGGRRAQVWLALARSLAQGEGGTPVRTDSVRCYDMGPGGVSPGEADIIRSFPCTQWDDQGRVVGSLITGIPTPHRLVHPGGAAWTWCIFDAMLAGLVLPGPVRVQSTCPASGREVGLDVRPLRAGRGFRRCSEGNRSAAGPWRIRATEAANWVTVPAAFEPGMDLRADFCCRTRLWAQRPAAIGSESAPVAWLAPDEAFAVTVEVARRLRLV